MTDTWFQQLFGFVESSGPPEAFERNKAKFELLGTKLTSRARPDRTYEAGIFTTPSVGELRQACDMSKARKQLPGPLKVSEVIGDVSKLHIDPENRFALFQAASQFNCLEFLTTDQLPEDGVSTYSWDRTQGPACAIACAPGTIVRNYFGLDGHGQRCDKQIENLREIEELLSNREEKYFDVIGGYTLAVEDGLRRLTDRFSGPDGEALRAEAISLLRIGLQEDTEVTGSDFGKTLYEGPQHLVSQIYCAACSPSYSLQHYDAAVPRECWAAFASLVLEGAYEATLLAAVQNAQKHKGEPGAARVFLTALGGGVFGNESAWILGAMRRAFDKFRGVGLDVVIVSYCEAWAAAEPLLGSWNQETRPKRGKR